MFKKTAVALATAAVMAVGAPAALASGPLTVTVGGVGGDHSFTASTKSPGVTFLVTGEAGVVEMGCTSATASGTIHGGTTGLDHRIASISATTWTGCIGPSEIPMNVVPNHSPVWDIIADHDGNITSGTNDVINGEISGVVASVVDKLTVPAGGLCSFDVTGSVDATFDEGAQQLNVSGNTLQVANVSGCFGAFTDGDPVSFDATYNISTSGNVYVS